MCYRNTPQHVRCDPVGALVHSAYLALAIMRFADQNHCVGHAHRSVTMDAWSADQLKKMQVGGNGKLNAFFKNYGIAKETEIKQKYSGQVAEVSWTSVSCLGIVRVCC